MAARPFKLKAIDPLESEKKTETKRIGAFRLETSKPPMEKCEQSALFAWAKYHEKEVPELRWLFAIPNGLWLPKRIAVFAKKQGLKAGVSDLFLPVSRGGYHGIFIEMKRKDGVKSDLSKHQKSFMEFAIEQGYKAEWCRGWEEAKELLTNYLSM